MATAILTFENVSKRYRSLVRGSVGLAGATINLGRGQAIGIVGPNGAGKSTLIHLALGYLRPDSGEIRLFGRQPFREAIRDRVGWMPDKTVLPTKHTARFVVTRWLQAHGLSANASAERAHSALLRYGICEIADRSIDSYSYGTKRKVSLLLALSHEPELVVLDEPYLGLDAGAVACLQEDLRHLIRNGASCLISSHQIADLSAVVTEICALEHGQVVGWEKATITDAGRLAVVRVNDPERLEAFLRTAMPTWAGPFIRIGDRFVVNVPSTMSLSSIAVELEKLGAGLFEVAIGRRGGEGGTDDQT